MTHTSGSVPSVTSGSVDSKDKKDKGVKTAKHMPWVQPRSLEQLVLLFVAERQGRMLDVREVKPIAGVLVHDVIRSFEGGDSKARPVQVRVALQDLIVAGYLVPVGGDRSGDCMKARSQVGVTCRGLVKARELDPWCARERKTLTLRTQLGKSLFAVKIDTGNTEQDLWLNRSGTVVAAVFVVLALRPTLDRPLVVAERMECFHRLATFGIGRRSGPKADRPVSEAAVRRALDKLCKVLNLSRYSPEDDERREHYYLSDTLPEVQVVAGDPRHYGDWESYSNLLWRVVMGQTLNATPQWWDVVFPGGPDNGVDEQLRGEVERLGGAGPGVATEASAAAATTTAPIR